MARAYAGAEGLLYFETSALSGKGVQDMFLNIAHEMPTVDDSKSGSSSNEMDSIRSEVCYSVSSPSLSLQFGR